VLTVVFGAGASFDSIPHLQGTRHQWRPPCAEDLWDPRFDSIRARWGQTDEIVPILRGKALGSVEETLKQLAEDGQTYPPRLVQIEAIRWYLHHLMWSVGRHWGEEAQGLTNYVTLLGELDRLVPSGEPICLVTFNYDRFLDDALSRRGVDLSEIVSHGPPWLQGATFPSPSRYTPSIEGRGSCRDDSELHPPFARCRACAPSGWSGSR
jgi:hypothetical protein